MTDHGSILVDATLRALELDAPPPKRIFELTEDQHAAVTVALTNAALRWDDPSMMIDALNVFSPALAGIMLEQRTQETAR